MTQQQYCNNKVLQPGSGFYYSVKKINPLERDKIIAIQAFYAEIEDIIFHFSDLSVAEARLNWWRKEILGHATHPILQCLQHHQINPEKLFSIVDGFEQNLAFLSFASYDEVVVHFMRTAGERELLFANVMQENSHKEQVYHAMLVIELTRYIQHLRKYIQRDLIYFSEDELNQFQIERNDFQKYITTPAIQNLLRYQFEKIQRAYQKINKNKLNKFLRARVQIAYKVIQEIAASEFAVLESFIDLTPLRKWWVINCLVVR